MIDVGIGLALLAGATFAARRRGSSGGPMGVLAQAITPGMTDEDFVDELHYRATMAYGFVDESARSIYDEAGEEIQEKPDCGAGRQKYMLARDAIAEARSGFRDARVGKFVKKCWGRSRERTEQCRRFIDATNNFDLAVEWAPQLRRDLSKACGTSMPAPFEGMYKAITPGMGDDELSKELARRAHDLSTSAGIAHEEAGWADLNHRDWEAARGNLDDEELRIRASEACVIAKNQYATAIQDLSDVRSAFRSPRALELVTKCMRGQADTGPCGNVRNARNWMDSGLRSMKAARAEVARNCGSTLPSIPLSGRR